MTVLVAGGLQVQLLQDQKLYQPQSPFQLALRRSHHSTKLGCSGRLLVPPWYHICERIKNTQQLWVRGVRKWEKNSPVGSKVKEEEGEKVLQVLDQFPSQFMEDQTRPSVSMAVYRRPHSGSGKPGNLAARQFTHYRLSNQKESSLSWINIQTSWQCLSLCVGTVIKRSIYCVFWNT